MKSRAVPLLHLAFSRPVVRRALRYALPVGAVLITINHGDALARGELTPGRVLRMLLTAMVPYVVSTLSSLEAMLGSPESSRGTGADIPLQR